MTHITWYTQPGDSGIPDLGPIFLKSADRLPDARARKPPVGRRSSGNRRYRTGTLL
jgi:hypothetical protein